MDKQKGLEPVAFNTYEGDVAIYGDFALPVPTYEFDKKIDFSVILSILLVSNGNPKEDDYRYINYNRLNKDAICKECGISRKTLERRLQYLDEKNIITLEKTSKGYVYIIRCSKDGKYFVSVQHKLLKDMLKCINKEAIRVYMLLKVQLDRLKNERPMTNAFIASQLGYSVNSKNNLDKIGSWTNMLVDNGFIKKRQYRVYKESSFGKAIIGRVDTYYQLNDLKPLKKALKG